jgi:5-methylcytosine-specific restriction endonuclease McrA
MRPYPYTKLDTHPRNPINPLYANTVIKPKRKPPTPKLAPKESRYKKPSIQSLTKYQARRIKRQTGIVFPRKRKRYNTRDGLRQDQRRKLRLKENGGSHTPEQWQELQKVHGYRCVKCGIHAKDTPQGYLTRDHITPVSKGGSDDIGNIQPMCLRCNFRKNTKDS